MYTVYIIYSPKLDRYYIGYTGGFIEERIKKHNSNHKGFTGGIGDWILCYCEKYELKNEAIMREKEIKSWKSRRRITQLVQSIPT